MIVVKIRNAAELLWDSLDDQERKMLAYAVCYLAVTIVVAYQRASRQRMLAELREEIRAELPVRS